MQEIRDSIKDIEKAIALCKAHGCMEDSLYYLTNAKNRLQDWLTAYEDDGK